jgi:hypothetical protein
LKKSSIQTLVSLSPEDPDDDVADRPALLLAWEEVLNRRLPASWRFHCMDGEPTAGDFGDDPFGVFEGVQLTPYGNGEDVSLNVGQFLMLSLQNGAEYYCRLQEDEGEELWEDEHGKAVHKDTPGAHWVSGGDLAWGRHQGCSEIHVTVRDHRVLEVLAERVLHGPTVPPFTTQLWATLGTPDLRVLDKPKRMWLPWADFSAWEAWRADDESNLPVLHEYSL